jgi:hypothetical protein
MRINRPGIFHHMTLKCLGGFSLGGNPQIFGMSNLGFIQNNPLGSDVAS